MAPGTVAITALIVIMAVLTAAPATVARAAERPRQLGLPALSRDDFNRLATRQGLPLFWVKDLNANGLIEPDELAATGEGQVRASFVARGAFTTRFVKAYQALVELRRQEAVARELDGGHPTLVLNDFSRATAVDRAVLKEILAAAKIIEELYLRQTGGSRFAAQLRRWDAASQTLFWRNHGPWCVGPAAREDPFCHGHPEFPPRRSEAYPPEIPQDDAMCKLLREQPNARDLLDPFTVVRRRAGKLIAVPLHQAFGARMRAVAGRLRAAAAAAQRDPAERALVRYLLAAAKGFETNSWGEADEAWAAMSSTNSRWYLRIAPDEVYFDPCQQKAGFHVSLARIDRDSLAWQTRLNPLRATMEQALARLIGPSYKAREVRFQMPDFIQVVLNAGDARHPLGATIGQSLPNWGQVAQEGRGRTVVMSNLYTDPDSMRIERTKARALLSEASLRHYTESPQPALLNIILHEASHNFGPHSDYRIKGRSPKEIFGGKLASTLEELKAQTAGLWYLKLLRDKGLIDDAMQRRAYLKAITWSFSHISRGMFTPDGNVQPYSQLSAVQVGTFVQDGALTFKDGKFSIHFEKLPGSIDRLMKRVGQIKASGDAKAARELIDHFVSGKGRGLVQERHIARELLRYPKATFLYSVVY